MSQETVKIDQETIFNAIEVGDRAILGAWLSGAPDFSMERHGSTPAMQAIQSKRVDILELLLDAGSPIDGRARGSGYAPLHFAAALDTPSMKLLLERGADPRLRSRSGATTLMCAVPDVERLRLALDTPGAGSVHDLAAQGKTALHCAFEQGFAETARELAKRGADPLQATWENETCAMLACSLAEPAKRSVEVLALALEMGGDIKAVCLEGLDALYRFAKGGWGAGALFALSHGANPDIECEQGYRALTHAVFAKNAELACALVRAGASIDFKNGEGHSLQESLRRAGASASDCDPILELLECVAEAESIKRGLKPTESAERRIKARL